MEAPGDLLTFLRSLPPTLLVGLPWIRLQVVLFPVDRYNILSLINSRLMGVHHSSIFSLGQGRNIVCSQILCNTTIAEHRFPLPFTAALGLHFCSVLFSILLVNIFITFHFDRIGEPLDFTRFPCNDFFTLFQWTVHSSFSSQTHSLPSSLSFTRPRHKIHIKISLFINTLTCNSGTSKMYTPTSNSIHTLILL